MMPKEETKKAVRFQDLSLIQEQEEDGPISIVVPDLPAPESLGDEPRPAACPFGERIARERAEKEKQKEAEKKARCRIPDPPAFPQNIIQLQAEEKERLKVRPTAGINPEAGKERGRSFVTYSNYLCSTTDNTINLQPGTAYQKSFEVAGNSSQYSGASQGSPRGTEFRLDPRCSGSIPLASHLIPSLIGEGAYQPEQPLAQTVNPYLAPSLQFYGSAAYGLKPTPQETLSKPDVITSSSTNQYLHRHQDCTSTDQYLTQTSSATSQLPPQTVAQTTTAEASMNFLRDNFPTPVPISKDTLFHLDEPRLKYQPNPPCSPQITNTTPAVTFQPTQQFTMADTRQNYPSIFQPTSSGPVSTQSLPPQGNFNTMASITGYERNTPSMEAPRTSMATTLNYVSTPGEIYSTVSALSRVQEKEELQKLNDRFTAYVNRVRQLSQQAHSVDTSAFLRSTKILEEEIVNLKAVYEAELEKLRKELEASSHEKLALAAQNNKQTIFVGELQDRLNIETDKSAKLLDEINLYQRKISALESQVSDATLAMQRPNEEVDQLRRNIENLTREVEQWKHRYDHEQVVRQDAEGKVQQMLQKIDLADQIHNQQIADYQSRLDMASASIISLEAKVRDLSTADVSVAEMLKQVRESAETELKKFQIESEEQYARNLTALKAQIDNDADALQRFQTEKSQLTGSIGELHAKIRNLEGQVANLQHQKQTLEDAVAVERNRSADNIQILERKLREVQDLLIVKMKEVTNAREANLPLKAEIEALKILLEEEEKRLRIPLGIVPATIVQASVPPSLTTSQIVGSTQSHSQILNTGSATNQVLSQASKQALIGSEVQQQYAPPATASVSLPPVTAPCVVSSQVAVTSSVLPVHGTSATTAVTTTAEPVTTDAQGTVSLEANYDYSSTLQRDSGLTNPLYPYIPSPPLDPMYVPEALQSTEEGTLAYDADYGAGFSGHELYMHGFSLPMTGPRYHYETTPSVNRLQADPSPRAVGPIRAKSAPANAELRTATVEFADEQEKSAADIAVEESRKRNLNLIPSNLGSGRDYFDDMFNDLQRATLYSKPRPKSSPLHNRLPSSFHDYTVSTSSAIGDLKVLEVNQEGKFVRLVNDGPTEFEFGGYMIQQNVGGHPVAVYRFPPRTKFPPDSTITVWSAMNDPKLHNPPTDFFWKEQQKWGTGPECTTILCRANGQAVAWTTAAHRFTKDAFIELTKTEEKVDDAADDESLTELNLDANGPKPGNVYLRREKQQPRSLVASKHPHGSSPSTPVHPHVTQPRPLKQGNDNSSVNRQSRTQTTRPDPIPGQPYAGAPAQRMGSAPLKKMACSNAASQPTTIRGNGSIANKPMAPGDTSEGPNPFMKPRARFGSGLDQISSQHHPDFLPPMPHPPETSW